MKSCISAFLNKLRNIKPKLNTILCVDMWVMVTIYEHVIMFKKDVVACLISHGIRVSRLHIGSYSQHA